MGLFPSSLLHRTLYQTLVKITKYKVPLHAMSFLHCYLPLHKSRNKRQIFVRNHSIISRFGFLTVIKKRWEKAEDGGNSTSTASTFIYQATIITSQKQ
jgi:hypothetical protein